MQQYSIEQPAMNLIHASTAEVTISIRVSLRTTKNCSGLSVASAAVDENLNQRKIATLFSIRGALCSAEPHVLTVGTN